MANDEETNNGNELPTNPLASTPPTTRAIGFVAIAVLIVFLLVLIVDSDNSSSKDKQKAKGNTVKTSSTSSTTTTTTATKTQANKDTKETTTTKAIAGVRNPAEVTVLVLNGSSVSGVASKLAVSLQGLKYKVLPAGDSQEKASGTTVYYKSGFQSDAQQLAINVVPGLLNELNIKQQVTTKAFPASAPVGWDQTNLVTANVVVVIGNAV